MITLQLLKKSVRRLGLRALCRPSQELSNEEVNHVKNDTQNKATNSRDFKSGSTLSGAVQKKYNVFRDVDATEIFDVEEERRKTQEIQRDKEELPYREDEEENTLNYRRNYGVFEIEDLVSILHKENVEDVFVCCVPESLKYVDYLVVCQCRSYKHMLATAGFIRQIFKANNDGNEILPKIEGKRSRDWMAMDLGNIALHIFSSDKRAEYDLESLWAIGAEYDLENNKPEKSYGDMFLQSVILGNNFNK